MTRPPIDELEAMLAKATPGPWEAGALVVRESTGEGDNFSVGDAWLYPPTGEAGPVAVVAGAENGALIVAARNELPALIAYVRALESLAAARGRALAELVACKDLHDFLEADLLPDYRAQHAAELADMAAEYKRRKPLAWEAARAALAAIPASAPGRETE